TTDPNAAPSASQSQPQTPASDQCNTSQHSNAPAVNPDQGATQQTAPSGTASSTPDMSGANGGQQSVTGCLQGSGGNFTLTDNNGKSWTIQSDNSSQLTPHIGHTVSISGSSSGADSLKVSSVNMISENCTSGSASSGAGATSNAAAPPAATSTSPNQPPAANTAGATTPEGNAAANQGATSAPSTTTTTTTTTPESNPSAAAAPSAATSTPGATSSAASSETSAAAASSNPPVTSTTPSGTETAQSNAAAPSGTEAAQQPSGAESAAGANQPSSTE